MGELVDDVREKAKALVGLLGQASDLVPSAQAELREGAERLDAALRREKVAVLVVGGADAGKRAFMNAVAGERLFRSDAREPPSAVIVLENAATASYVARLRDGRVIDFATAMRDREDSFDRAQARAERDREGALLDIDEAKARIAREQAASTAPPPPPEPAPRSRKLTTPAKNAPLHRRIWLALRAFLHRLVDLVLSIGGSARSQELARPPESVRARLASRPKIPPAQQLAEAEARLEAARAALARVEEERARYAEERRRELLTDVRSFTDASRRGDELDEIVVAYPCAYLPEGVVLVDAPGLARKETRESTWKKISDHVAVCVVIAPDGDVRALVDAELTQRMHPVPIQVLGGAAGIDEEAFASRLEGESSQLLGRARQSFRHVVAARAVAEMLAHVHVVAEAAAKLESKAREHVEELEKQRLPHPTTFKRQLLEQMTNAIAKSAHDVTKKSVALLRTRVAELRDEWTAAIEACGSRSEIQACVTTMNESAPQRLSAMLEKIGDDVLRDMQRAAEALQAFALEEMRAQYRSRKSYDDPAAPIVVEMPDDVAALASAPLGDALANFEKRRVSIGLGGAAAGAALGTAIFPVIGTAIGAFVGVFAGFLEGIGTLKKECTEKVVAHLAEVEQQVAERLGGGAVDLARDLRTAVEQSLEQSLKKREETILRMLDLEAKALEREKKKLVEASLLRAALTEQENALVALAQVASERLKK